MKSKVFVVDDDELIRKTLDRVLDRAGYEVLTAASGAEALEILARKPEVRVFVLDLMMAGMNGLQLCREIKKTIGAECVIYALTGHVQDYHVEACREAGFDDYFTKPFNVTTILNAVALAVEKVERWQSIR